MCFSAGGRLTDLLSLPVSPRDPTASITAVLDLVHLGELIADAPRMTALRAHKGDKVERAKVDLEELLQVVWLHSYLWTPGAVALLEVQPGGDRKEGETTLGGRSCWNPSRKGKRGRGGWKGKGERKVQVSAAVGFSFFQPVVKTPR